MVDDLRVLSGIIVVNRNGLRWCDNGVSAKIIVCRSAESSERRTIKIIVTDEAAPRGLQPACENGPRSPD